MSYQYQKLTFTGNAGPYFVLTYIVALLKIKSKNEFCSNADPLGAEAEFELEVAYSITI